MYAVIYGRVGTLECAAVTLTQPVQGLVIGALSGLSSAAGILIGKRLGQKAYDDAYQEAKSLLKMGLLGAVALSVILISCSRLYVKIYNVENVVREMTVLVLYAFAIISPVKVLNMILGGGIIRSGGKTKYVMVIDSIGTWLFGVPLGLLCAFVWRLPIYGIYFVLSLEECVRLMLSLYVFGSKWWMRTL